MSDHNVLKGGAARWVLCDEIQQVIWANPNAVPEIVVSIADFIAEFDSKSAAIVAAIERVSSAGAVPTFADVRPIEECSKCGCDFHTREFHHVLAVSEEIGPIDNPTLLQCFYVARVCTECEPVLTQSVW